MSASKLDAVYRSILITKFFTKGWGKPENLRRLFEFRKVISNRDECFKLISRDYPVTITKEESTSDCHILEGHFMSPLERLLPGIVPECAHLAHFQALLPKTWPQQDCKPVCLHLAGTGDHFFWRRRNLMAKPLLKDAGIGAIILENPFYGKRKPEDQVRSSLHNVSDIFVMGGCLILESMVLFHWAERNGLGPLGVTGLSMGGHMASLAATNWPKPLVLVPCLSWSTASAVFTQGVMSNSINWELLESQYLSDGVYRDKLAKMVTIIDEAFLAGKRFAQKFSASVEEGTETSPKNISLDIENTKVSNTTDILNNIKKIEPTIKAPAEMDREKKLHAALKKLLDNKQVSEILYKKLTSKDKFELVLEDIKELNILNKKLLALRNSESSSLDLSEKKLNEYKTNTVENKELGENLNEIDKKFIADMTENIVLNSTSLLLENETNDSKIANEHLKDNLRTEPSKGDASQQVEISKDDVKLSVDIKKEDSGNFNKVPEKSRTISEITSDILSSIPYIKNKSSGEEVDLSKIEWRDQEARQFMRGMMDECTHLRNFTVPFDTSLIIAVCAKRDAYVPQEGVHLEELWPGAEVRYVDAGHVSAYLLHQSLFRSCIVEAFERSKKIWRERKHLE